FSELLHVVRNAVDHGLELPDERERNGKPRLGTLSLSARTSATQLTLEIADDGRGIDWDSIAEKAKARGLPHETEGQLLDALCADGVTTRAQVTDYSGRGVGMSAVRRRIESLNGQLEVRSTRGVGTIWTFHFPWHAASAKLRRHSGSLPSVA